MSIELVRDIINYEKLIGEGTSQTMVSGDIVLAERNPEFVRILDMDGRTMIVSSEVTEDRIMVEGKMIFEILYASNDEASGIYKVSATSSFNHSIQVPGGLPDMACRLATNIEHMGHELLTNRKIKVNAVINIKGMVYDKETVEMVTDMKGQDIQILKDTVEIDEYIVEDNGQSVIKGKIEIPDDKGEVKSILKTNVHIHKKDIAVQDGKVVVNACALIKALYDTTGGDDVYFVEQDAAFTHEMNIAGVKPGMKCDVVFKINDNYEDIKENENNERKIIEIEIVVDIKAKVYMKRELQNIEDAYSPQERFEFQKQSIKAMSFFGENTDNQNIKEKIMIPEDAPPINKVKHMNVNPIITDSKIVEDKVVVEGVARCCIMYLAASEEGGMASYEEEIPFKSSIDMPGAKFEMNSEVDAHVEHMSCDKTSNRELDVKILVETGAKVFSRSTVDVVKAVEEIDMSDNIKNMPSIIIYTIQLNDTLWKIAKKYSTTIEDIIKINELENPELVDPGMKILIPKKMFMRKN